MNSWNSTTHFCQWPGINCSNGVTVTEISLNSQNIEGEIPSSLCDLKNLTVLDLGNNYIQGNFPTFLNNCPKLQTLVLASNYFVGKLPNSINELPPSLQHLNLSANNFSGDIPPSLAQLKGLVTLYLDSNSFNGTFPSELGHLENLEELVLAYNPFAPNNLPREFGMLKNLKFLWMTQCNLIGEIPKTFANLSSLEQLNLDGNNLEGEVPSGLFLLKNLKILYLYNNRLSGELPTSFKAFNLVELDVSQNKLTGLIPEDIGKLQKLEILKLTQNEFHGTIPPSIAQLTSLKMLSLFMNRFSGSLPTEMGMHSELEGIEVSDNAFTGQLTENLCHKGKLLTCWDMKTVLLSNNQFSGHLPDKLAWNLSRVEISNNKMSGKIPSTVSTWSNLQVLKASNNLITGPVPLELTKLQQLNTLLLDRILQVLKASNNLITGPVPLELTKLSQLNSLLLDRNQLSGELPSEIISWQRLYSLDLSHNKLSGSIPSLLGSLPVLTDLDLSDNQFSGQIPPEVGQLKLTSLNLSSNQLTGKIPVKLDNSAYENSFLNTHLCSNTGFFYLPKCSSHHRKLYLASKYIALVILLAFVAFLATLYCMVFRVREIGQSKKRAVAWKLTCFYRLPFTEEKIIANLTEKNTIGSGGSSVVYRIPINQSGEAVAVKRIWNNKKKSNDLEKEFIAEVQVLGTIRHLNIVKLLCCISSENSKLLVYEYMEKQSLDRWIHKNKRQPVSSMSGSVQQAVLDWPARLKIAIDGAQGLSYMHNDCSPPIVHRDVKSSNILLDSEFNAKIADFGLAKILAKPGGEPNTVSAVAGSFGYMAPEYCYTSKVNEKIDIYSFGVVLLELVTGKEPHIGDEHTNLAEWALRHFNEGHPIIDVLDKEVLEPCYLEEMTTVFKIGLLCTSALPSFRPSMKQVLQLLQGHSILEGSGGGRTKNDRDVSPLLGGKNYISSCKNSRRTLDEDDYDMV
uniref:non-specific serine/threonine protein kinase n=1 Tax=Chenopodium quinoa TaxID=63459 RepID=A0A803N4A9_CHEQI